MEQIRFIRIKERSIYDICREDNDYLKLTFPVTPKKCEHEKPMIHEYWFGKYIGRNV